jgi:hypothetical protein
MIDLDVDGIYGKDRHWYCDAVAIDWADATIHLCEITHAKTLHSVPKRLQFWCNHWPEVVGALHRDSSLTGEWQVSPRVFIPSTAEEAVRMPRIRFAVAGSMRNANAHADRHAPRGCAPVDVSFLER